jgi:hypothetical protein
VEASAPLDKQIPLPITISGITPLTAMIQWPYGVTRRMLPQGRQFPWLKKDLYRRKLLEYQKTMEQRTKERDAALHENIVENLSRSATAKRLPRKEFDPRRSENHGSGGAGGAVADYIKAFTHG